MKKTLLICLLFAAGFTHAFAQQTAAKYKITWCGKSGNIKMSQVDSFMKVNCKKMILEGAGKDIMITSYTCTMTKKGGQPNRVPDLPGGMFFPSINHYLQTAQPGDEVVFSDIMVREPGKPMYVEKNTLHITITK